VDFRVAFDGDIYPTIVLNGFIHTIMYTYYFVSAHTKQIWWKKYLTTMQLVQFLAMNIQGSMIVAKKCTNFPPKIAIFYLIYVQSLFWLFMNFYIRAYVFSTKTNNKDKTLDRKLQGGASGAGIIQKEKLNKKIN
jgi:elongation of very long chain fatty acids protein 4